MFNKYFDYKFHSKETDRNGNKTVLDIAINGQRMTLINIYAPNRHNPECFLPSKQTYNN